MEHPPLQTDNLYSSMLLQAETGNAGQIPVVPELDLGGELYNVQRLTSNTIGSSCKVVICTIQRLYSMVKEEEEFIRATGPQRFVNPLEIASRP